MTTSEAAPAAETGGLADVRLAASRPGSRRLSIAGLVITAQAAFTIWSHGLVAVGASALDFTFGGVRAASDPGPFAFQDVPLGLAVAFGVVLPAAIAGVVGGVLLVRDQSRRLAIGLVAVWLVVGIGFAVVGGAGDLAINQALIACLVASGATAARVPEGLRRRFAASLPFVSFVSMFIALGTVIALTPVLLGQASIDFIRKPAPMSVWNDADAPSTLRLTGTAGVATFVIPAHGLVTLRVPEGIGEIREATTGTGTQIFDGSDFTNGGLIEIFGTDGERGGGFQSAILDRLDEVTAEPAK